MSINFIDGVTLFWTIFSNYYYYCWIQYRAKLLGYRLFFCWSPKDSLVQVHIILETQAAFIFYPVVR